MQQPVSLSSFRLFRGSTIFHRKSDMGFVAVRQALAGTPRSTGGRMGFPGAELRKIPITEPVWRIVAQADERRGTGTFRSRRPGPGLAAATVRPRQQVVGPFETP
jgi:hypothetical protein